MKKLALFVEGQTEQLFLKALVEAVAGTKHLAIVEQAYKTKAISTLELTRQRILRADLKYFVLIVDCQNDERVKSVVLEQRDSLSRAGYSLIVGLRDLYPTPLSELSKIKRSLQYRVPTAGIPTHILLAVSEVEAWFLQDHTHYVRIDARLDPSAFKAAFGFDPHAESAETVEWPSELLRRIYRSVGKTYKKKRSYVERTVGVLDYAQMYLNYPGKLPHLGELITHIDSFLA